MAAVLSPEIESRRDEIAAVCARLGVRRLELFGSGTRGAAAALADRRKIIAFRNVLVHGYAAVDDRLVWGVIENHLALAKSHCRRPARKALSA